MQSSSYDVVVVGARVAGASTALLLARAGLKVALLDRSAYGSDTLSTHGLMRAGVLQLSRWGVLPRVVEAGTPPVERTLFHYADGDTVQVSIRPSPGVAALYAPRRHVVDRILVDAAAAAGADVHHEVTVTDLLRAEDGRVTGVRAVSRSGTELRLGAGLTVGADGIGSVVADRVDAPVERASEAAAAVLYRYDEGVSAAGYEWAYGVGAAAGMLPTNDGLTCVFVSTTPEHMRALRREGTDSAFMHLFSQAAPAQVSRLRDARPAGRMHGWAGRRGYVRRSWGPGWALVGDAGYFKDPVTAHGMTDALRDAELLAGGVLDGFTGVLPATGALRGYQERRDDLSRRLFEATDRIASYDWDLAQVRVLLREVSSAMVDEVEALESLPVHTDGGPLAGIVPADTAVGPE